MLRVLLWTTVALHWSLFLANLCVVAAVLILAPWYVTIPVLHFEIQQFAGGRCPLTDLENWLRGRLGRPAIDGFIEHYVRRRWSED